MDDRKGRGMARKQSGRRAERSKARRANGRGVGSTRGVKVKWNSGSVLGSNFQSDHWPEHTRPASVLNLFQSHLFLPKALSGLTCVSMSLRSAVHTLYARAIHLRAYACMRGRARLRNLLDQRLSGLASPHKVFTSVT